MQSILVLIVLLFTATATHAQQVVASSGSSGSAAGYTVDWTLGEPVIETISNANLILTQGMHQPKLLATAIYEIEIPGLEVKIYPNPTDGFLNVEVVQTGKELFLYELSDITGRQIMLKQMQSNTEKIDMVSYVPGIYLIRVLNTRNEYVKVFKIIKNE